MTRRFRDEMTEMQLPLSVAYVLRHYRARTHVDKGKNKPKGVRMEVEITWFKLSPQSYMAPNLCVTVLGTECTTTVLASQKESCRLAAIERIEKAAVITPF